MSQTLKVTKQMKKVSNYSLLLTIICFCCTFTVAYSKSMQEPIYIIELPSAGVLNKGQFSMEANFFKLGGLRLAFNLAPFKNFIFGASFGGTNIIGVSKIQFQKYPGIQLKYRFIDESQRFPAIAFGIATQGYGPYDDNQNRFQTFSPGVFLVASKAFQNYFGLFDIHFGLNYSLDPKPRDRGVNFFFGLCQTAWDFFRLNLEYNANLDEKTYIVLKNKGILNISMNFFLSYNLVFGITFKDLLGNFNNTNSPERNLFIQYTGKF